MQRMQAPDAVVMICPMLLRNAALKAARPLPLDIPTIETAGGLARCMLAGIHLTRRTERTN